MLATLYSVEISTIDYHIKKTFKDSELQEDSVIRKFGITALDGKIYNTNHYSLEMIIAVGFKVNSERAVHGNTATELIVERTDHTKVHMGLTTWMYTTQLIGDETTIKGRRIYLKQLMIYRGSMSH